MVCSPERILVFCVGIFLADFVCRGLGVGMFLSFGMSKLMLGSEVCKLNEEGGNPGSNFRRSSLIRASKVKCSMAMYSLATTKTDFQHGNEQTERHVQHGISGSIPQVSVVSAPRGCLQT